jgi:hypothetical protein
MNANNDLERRIADFYATEAPPRAPDWVLESALETIDTTRQRRALIRVPWRFPPMNSYAKLAVAAVAVIAVGAIGLAVMRPAPTPGVGGPGVSPSPPQAASNSPSPSASALPALTESFTSDIQGISISYPSGWTVTPATEPWVSGLPPACDPPCADRIYEKDTDSPFIGLSSQPLAGRSGDQWAAAVLSDSGWGSTCDPATEPVSIDGASGMIASQCSDRPLVALASVQDRGYLIVLYRIEDQAWLRDVLATVQLQPEDAVGAAPSSSPSSSP